MTRLRNPISDSAISLRNPLRNPISDALVFPPLPITANLIGQWDPSNLASLDASSDGDPVGLESDLSGLGNDATQSGGLRPILKFGISGFATGISVIEYNGSTTFLDVGDRASLETNDFTLFIVARRRSTGLAHTFGSVQNQIAGAGGPSGYLADSDPNLFRGNLFVGTNSSQGVVGGTPGTTSRILTVQKSGTTFTTWMGSAFIGSVVLISSVMDYSTNFTKRTLWGALHFDSGTPTQFRFLDGWLGERLIFSDGKDASDRAIIWNYLSSKWGVAL